MSGRWLGALSISVSVIGSATGGGPLVGQAVQVDTIPPDYVRAVDLARVRGGNPAEAAEGWLLAFIDIETTGLVPGYHEPIDVGVAITDLDGVMLDSFFVRIIPRHPERLSPGAQRVNAFALDRWQDLGALSPGAAVDSLVRFHARVAGERPTLMVAFNSQFDAAFLDHLFRGEGRTWRELYHYFVLDVPSMAWGLGYRDLVGGRIADRLGVPDEPHVAADHTGLTGALVNVRIYRALVERGFAVPGSPAGPR